MRKLIAEAFGLVYSLRIAYIAGDTQVFRYTILLLNILVLVGFSAGVARSGVDKPTAVDVAIVLAVDVSGSVDGDELALQRGGYALALRHRDFIRAVGAGWNGRVALSYLEWSGRVFPGSVTPWRIIDDAASAENMAAEIVALPMHSDHATSISRAIDFAVALIDVLPVAAERRIIDVSGDGVNNMGAPVAEARDRAVARGVTINALPLLLRPEAWGRNIESYFADCVIGGEGAFVLPARSYEELAQAIRRKLILEISGAAGQARLSPAGGPLPDCSLDYRGPGHTGTAKLRPLVD